MAHVTPQFNVKTGSDSQLFFSREVTAEGDNKGKIIDNVIRDDGNVYEYPQLTRRTGHSIKGTTETIESSELRKGRTKAAPRKGNSSSEGSLDIELSPETYDDIFEATLRNNWEAWTSDDGDLSVNPDKITCATGQFVSNGKTEDGGYRAVTLVGTDDNCIVKVDDTNLYTIEQLKIGTEDIKYSALAQYGGITGEDLYQEFQHLAVNTMDLSVSPGQIVTGSFGFQGSNNPNLLQETYGKTFSAVGTIATQAIFDEGVYYTRSGAGTTTDPYVYTKAENWSSSATYYQSYDGIVKEMAVSEDGTKGRFNTTRKPAAVEKWVNALADKYATTTDQFTAREGFMYINGRRVQFGSNLTLNLNNGLKQLYAIFERDAISTAPMSLDITGTLDAYLITNYAEFLYNYGINDDDVEIVFSFQDKEDNPDYTYVFQIFKAKFETDISQGSEELTVSLPFTSFGERAMRIFRIKRENVGITNSFDKTRNTGTVNVIINDKPATIASGDLLTTCVKADGTSLSLTAGTYDPATGTQPYTYAATAETQLIFTAKYKDIYAKKGYTLA